MLSLIHPYMTQLFFIPQSSGGVAPVNKQKAAAGADGKNRRALEDIGNLANLRINEG